MLVNLVGHHPNLRKFPQDFREGFEFGARVHLSRRIARRVQHQPPRLRRNGAAQASRRERQFRAAIHPHRFPAHQPDNVRVVCPVRSRQDDLVARIQRCQKRIEQDLFCTGGDDHFRRVRRESGLRPGIVADGLAQFRQPLCGRIADSALPHGGAGLLDYMRRRRKIGLSGAETEHVLARGPHGPGLLGNAHDFRKLKRACPRRASKRC